MATELWREILAEIDRQGAITFARFMELALYHPLFGYYTSDRVKIGRQGDYYTSTDVHPLFGRMLARQLAEMVGHLDDEPVALVEFGPGKGQLAHQILTAMHDEHPSIWPRLHYRLVEISPCLQREQAGLLHEFANRVTWLEHGEALPPGLQGVVFANEFLDALPVHRLIMDHGELQEIYVAREGDQLAEVYGALSDERLSGFLELAGLELQGGQVVEASLAALDWLALVAGRLDKGFVLTIDYGYRSWELAAPHRQRGTLIGYRHHQVMLDPYAHVGEQDLTAHVNFSALEAFGSARGLACLGYTTQMKFLVNLGILEAIDGKPADTATIRAVKQLIMPEGMGESFKVLIQGKNVGGVSIKSFKKWSG